MSEYLELEEQANQLVSHLESLRSSITSFDSTVKDLDAMRGSFANAVQQLTICAEAIRDVTAKLKALDEAALLEAIASLRADVLAQESSLEQQLREASEEYLRVHQGVTDQFSEVIESVQAEVSSAQGHIGHMLHDHKDQLENRMRETSDSVQKAISLIAGKLGELNQASQATASRILTLQQEVLQAKRLNTIWNVVVIALVVLGFVVMLVVARNGNHMAPDSAEKIKNADYAQQYHESLPFVQARSVKKTS